MSITSDDIKNNGYIHPLADAAADEIEQLEKQEEELRERIKQLEQELASIKKQFINYENADAYELDMMIEYARLQTLIMSIKEGSK